MKPTDEEIYITMVVVRRPARTGECELDPGRWAQYVLNSLEAEGLECNSTAGRGVRVPPGPNWSTASRIPPQENQRVHHPEIQPPRTRWIGAGLGILGLMGSALILYRIMTN